MSKRNDFDYKFWNYTWYPYRKLYYEDLKKDMDNYEKLEHYRSFFEI